MNRMLMLAVFSVACQGEGPPGGDDDPVRRVEGSVHRFLTDHGETALRGIDGVRLASPVFDPLDMAHVRMDQLQGGVPVFGGQGILHLDPSGTVVGLSDGLIRGLAVDVTPTLDPDAAIDEVLLAHGDPVTAVEADLQVLRHQGRDHLTYRVRVWDLDNDAPAMPVVFVDAHSGEEVWRYDNLQTAKDRRTHDGNNGSLLPGTLVRTEGQGGIGDAPVDDAHDHAGLTYDYYWLEQGRDSYDGLGASLISTAHHRVNYDNAFWNGTQMVYGDGGTFFTPLSGALDVVAHELTHAVTEHSANLIYAGESGGLNEATSDILGAAVEAWSQGWVIDADTWRIGEDIALPALGPALRFMDDPPLDGSSIDHYADFTPGMDVHFSSGIANKAFFLMVQDPALDMPQATDVWYRALTLYMTPSTTFAQARTATIDAATDLFGAASAQVAAVASAWDAVGVVSFEAFDVQTGLSAPSGGTLDFQYIPPAGATAVQFAISGGTGDADLYVRLGSPPTTTVFDCRPFLNGNNETCTFNPAQAGTYHVMIRGFTAFSGVTLTASQAGAAALLPLRCVTTASTTTATG